VVVDIVEKLLVTIVIILFVGVSIPSTGRVLEQSTTISSDGITLYVGGSGEGNYTKIQDAIDNASDGDTVFVYNGTYNEELIINKSINLIGEDKNSTYINGSLKVVVTFVTVKGFTIRGIFLESNHITILENIVNGTIFSMGLRNYISNNIINSKKNANAIIVWRDNTKVIGNIINSHLNYGILVHGNNNIIHENTIENPKNEWALVDIYVELSKNNIITNNTLISLGGSSFGINLFVQCRNNTIEGNKIMNYSGYGLGIGWGSNNNMIRGNTFSNNDVGLGLTRCQFNKILNNNFLENKRNAEFNVFSFYNKWDGNYWGITRLLPKPIIGSIGLFIPSWVNFDWHPAQEPYDISNNI